MLRGSLTHIENIRHQWDASAASRASFGLRLEIAYGIDTVLDGLNGIHLRHVLSLRWMNSSILEATHGIRTWHEQI